MNEIRIPGFQVLEKLGEGGMATVWKARQVSLDRVVAVKVLSSQFASDPEDVQQFQSEAQSAARLKHPGIIQVHDAGIYSGLYYFVMEYIGGYTVGDWVRRKGTLTEKDALLVADCVADALGYAWETAGIIHCDIKPDNVMVDSDGAVKVADLGLARTISGMTGIESQHIMGTPAYVSPEQASGNPKLDCRADIYSLGAMLYHLVTGTMLFHGESDEDVMELQISGNCTNPCDVVSGLSRPVCRLIEMMLAKDPAHRPADWRVVRREIARVQKGIVPRGGLPAGAQSTVAPRQGQTVRRTRPAAGTVTDRRRRDSRIGVIIAATVIFAAALLAGYLVYKAHGKREPGPVSVQPADREPAPVELVPAPSAEERAKGVFETAMSWARENPDKHDKIIERLTWAEKQAEGTPYARRAREELLRVSAERSAAIREVMGSLQRQAETLADAGRNLDAADLLEDYRGEFAEETREERVHSAVGFRRRHQQEVHRENAERQRLALRLNTLTDAVADDLWKQETAGARARVSEALADPAMADVSDRLREMDRLLNRAVTADDRVKESFEAQIGQEITVNLQKRNETFIITSVKDGRVQGEREMKISEGTVRAGVMFSLSELSPEEQLQRMGPEDDPGTALARGLFAVKIGEHDKAREYFGKTLSRIGDGLIQRLDAPVKTGKEKEARDALLRLLGGLGIEPTTTDPSLWVPAARRARVPSSLAGRVRDALRAFRDAHGETDFASKAEPVLEALAGGVPVEEAEPESQPSIEIKLPPDVAAAEGNAQAVLNLLLRKNGGLEPSQVTMTKDVDKRIVSLVTSAGSLRDIGAVAALRDLRSFTCVVGGAEGELKDLEALRGLPLETLVVRNCRVGSLAVIPDLPALKHLDVAGTRVRDLIPLRGTALKVLNIADTKVTDFSPIRDLDLVDLDVSGTQARDVRFAAARPLKRLWIARTKVFDFSFLRMMPELEDLNVSGTQIRTISSLQGLPLKRLCLRNAGISDLSALSGMPLQSLDIGETLVSDLSALAGLKMTDFRADGSRVKDISVLNGMPLRVLILDNTGVKDLWAARGNTLQHLSIWNTDISDLQPLAGTPLVHLDCRGTKVNDFGPLAGSGLTSLAIDEPAKHLRFIISLRKLRTLNGIPAHKQLQLLFKKEGKKGRHR